MGENAAICSQFYGYLLPAEAEGAGLHSGAAEEGTAAQQVCGSVLPKETLSHIWFPVKTAAMEMSFQIMNSSGEVCVMGSWAAVLTGSMSSIAWSG